MHPTSNVDTLLSMVEQRQSELRQLAAPSGSHPVLRIARNVLGTALIRAGSALRAQVPEPSGRRSTATT